MHRVFINKEYTLDGNRRLDLLKTVGRYFSFLLFWVKFSIKVALLAIRNIHFCVVRQRKIYNIKTYSPKHIHHDVLTNRPRHRSDL